MNFTHCPICSQRIGLETDVERLALSNKAMEQRIAALTQALKNIRKQPRSPRGGFSGFVNRMVELIDSRPPLDYRADDRLVHPCRDRGARGATEMSEPKMHAERPGAIGFTPYTYCGRRKDMVALCNGNPTCTTCRRTKGRSTK